MPFTKPSAGSVLTEGLAGPLLVTEGFGPQGPALIVALSVSPGRIKPNHTTTITFVGTGTTWTTTPPTFSATGAPAGGAGWLLGVKTVIDDTHATLVVTAGPTQGTVVFVDSTTSKSATLVVANKTLKWPFMRRYR